METEIKEEKKIPKGFFANKEVSKKLREIIYMIEHESVIVGCEDDDIQRFKDFITEIKYFIWKF